MDLDGKGLFIAIDAVTIGLVFEAKQLKYVVLWILVLSYGYQKAKFLAHMPLSDCSVDIRDVEIPIMLLSGFELMRASFSPFWF